MVAVLNAIHVLVWNGNYEGLDALVKSQHNDRKLKALLEEKEIKGNRALHLALKLAHPNTIDIVRCLLHHGARVRSRDAGGWKTLHHAIASNNKEVLKLLIQKEIEQAPLLWRKKVADVSAQLKNVVDFYCELHVQVASWVPGVSQWLPSDTIRIWKRKQDLRLDLSLRGFDYGTWKKGKLSFILRGEDQQLFCINHESREYVNLLSDAKAVLDAELEEKAERMMHSTIMTTHLKAAGFNIQPKLDWLSGGIRKENIGPWKDATVYRIEGLDVALHIRQSKESATNSEKSVMDNVFTFISKAADKNASPKINIDPNSRQKTSLHVSKNEVIQWRFSSAHYDIGFSVKYSSDRSAGAWEDIVHLKRVSSHKREEKGCYRAVEDGRLMLTWDNSYSSFTSKSITFRIELVDSEGDERVILQDISHRVSMREKIVLFRDWFGIAIDELPTDLRKLHPKRTALMHHSPACRTISKHLSGNIHMSRSFPLSVQEFLPIAQILSSTADTFENMESFFNMVQHDGFPVQFTIPILPSLTAKFRFDQLELCASPHALFNVPQKYKLSKACS